jgi:CHAT domain-containing protein/tetratricopeptide (TPR) repeat protein
VSTAVQLPLTDRSFQRDAARLVGRRLLATAAVAAAAGFGVSHAPPAELPHGLLPMVADRAGMAPCLEPMLSLLEREKGCAASASAAANPLPAWEVARMRRRTRDALRRRMDADALHADALVDLLWSGGQVIALDRSISSLQRASELSGTSVPVLTDWAAALLVRWQAAGNPRDALLAADVAARAARLDPFNRAARYNLALALEEAGLVSEAAAAWRGFMKIGADSPRVAEAQRHALQLEGEAGAVLPAPPPADASVPNVQGFAARFPQEALRWGWEVLLGDWGAARLRGDTAGAARRLAAAALAGDELARRGGDCSLQDAVRAIRRRADDPHGLAALARAHAAYAAGRRRYAASGEVESEPWLREAAIYGASSPALEGWATAFRGAALAFDTVAEHRIAGERMLRRLLPTLDTVRHPALAGRARWNLGTVLLRKPEYAEALRLYRSAEAMFARARETENLGAIQYLQTDALFSAGDMEAGFRSMRRALQTLRPYRASLRLHNLLYVSAKAAQDDGLGNAALYISDEDVTVAKAIPNGQQRLAEAVLVRAWLRSEEGRPDDAVADVQAGRDLLSTLPRSVARQWFESDLVLAEAALGSRADPGRGAARLDAAIAFFTRSLSPPHLLQAQLERSRARLSLGDLEGAAADLDAVLARVAGLLRTEPATVHLSLLDGVRRVVDRMVMLQLRAGRPAEALAYLERGRASLSPGRDGAADGAIPWAPAGRVVVDYGVIGDTLLIWTIRGPRVELTRRTVDRSALAGTVEQALTMLEGWRSDEAAPALQSLYDQLVRPVEGRLGPNGGTVVLVPDHELADVPFAALWDEVRRRYLVESHVLAIAATLREAAETERPRAPPAGPVLVVSDPAFDPAANPGLERLRGAAREADSVAAGYGGATMLRDAAASSERVRRELPRAGVVHYAGHAVADAARPEKSFLVLAPSGSDGGRLEAAAIGTLDLRGVRLVVLSACETLRARNGRAGGLQGLSGAFRGAGAAGIVGSIWNVGDGETLPLMRALHARYRASGDGAAALRQAQMELIRSGSPPAAWAAFRYMGN